MLHAAFVRSHLAHGRVLSVDASAAREAPGVALVLTAVDLDGVVGELEPYGPPTLATPPYRALADDKVRVTGEPLAIVVAETRALAEDACELVEVDIDPLPAMTTIADALDPDGPPLFDELGTNVMFHREDRYGDPDDCVRARGPGGIGALRATAHGQCAARRTRVRGRLPARHRTSSCSMSRTRTRTRSGARSRRCSTIRQSSSPCAVAISAARSARRRTPAARSCHCAPRRACSAVR